ncbi:flagellar biosynthesis protein FlgJ [Roseateles amylovorans]|jgi:peptidoglycan hydrolase FlgJ|uniref:Flagellar biosynthesis protein FlgJ n=1 Tax=Roseateles amylovorans TaxID=2978473 RepID=A0ABY6AYQ5_9BURK|nr:flagellar biosynthesis protein FlgJ [Roseateles amylovorans]UXH76879.1 flagellar biosynthesis protein FlgJ [Roseateles amylovorans]
MIELHTPQPLPLDAGTEPDARITARATEAAVKFEAFFIKQMISQMRAGTRALADEDSAEQKRVNQDMLDLADGLVADALAQQRAFGIADLMLQQVLPSVGLSSASAGSPSPKDSGAERPSAR